jgi:hypothetical protein
VEVGDAVVLVVVWVGAVVEAGVVCSGVVVVDLHDDNRILMTKKPVSTQTNTFCIAFLPFFFIA